MSALGALGTLAGGLATDAVSVVRGAARLPLDVARTAKRRTVENFGFSAIYNLVAAPAAMLGLVNPLVAALAMSGSSMIVTLNALRLGGDRRR